MDKRAFKNFITKRSTIWTLSLCMTGVLVLGGIAAVEKTRRSSEEQPETEIGQVAYLEEEIDSSDDIEESLFPTLEEDLIDDDTAQASAATADEEDTQTAAGLTGDETANASGENGDVQASAGTVEGEDAQASASVTDDESTGVSADATDGEDTETAAGVADSENTAADAAGESSDVQTSAGTADGEDVEASVDGTDSEEASSDQIISEEVLLEAGVSFTEDDTLVWPSAGTILIDYSMDGSVYFPTLNQYKYNPALIIGSTVGNQVLSSAKGIVESIFVDEETGTTLVLNLGNGYRLTYGQLKELAVSEGDVVEEGAVLGYVSEPTKYYSEEGSNLYFAMTKDGEPTDPVLYLE